jgi:hypothetical protein
MLPLIGTRCPGRVCWRRRTRRKSGTPRIVLGKLRATERVRTWILRGRTGPVVLRALPPGFDRHQGWQFNPAAVTRPRHRWRMSGGGGRLSKIGDGHGAARRGSSSGTGRVQPAARVRVWFRAEPDGRSAARKEFEELDVYAQAGLAKKMQRYRDGQARRQDVDHLTICATHYRASGSLIRRV